MTTRRDAIIMGWWSCF